MSVQRHIAVSTTACLIWYTLGGSEVKKWGHGYVSTSFDLFKAMFVTKYYTGYYGRHWLLFKYPIVHRRKAEEKYETLQHSYQLSINLFRRLHWLKGAPQFKYLGVSVIVKILEMKHQSNSSFIPFKIGKLDYTN